MGIEAGIILTCIGLAAGIGIFWGWQYRRMRGILSSLQKMLDEAVEGTFREKRYDETRISAIETRMAQYLKKSETIIRKMEQDKGSIKTLISDISHQTKTPLANISLYTQLLLEKELPREERNCVSQIQGQAGKLQFLIEALIKASRLENGIVTLHPKRQDVFILIEQAVEQIRKKAEERKIKIHCANHQGTKEKGDVVCDGKWTQEALYNILDNAVKYTEPGDEVTVSATPYELFYRIQITDHGPGILEDELGKVFQRFYRGRQVLEKEGVGIGLYLTSQIIQEEGGYVKVESTPGIETTFSVFLPKKDVYLQK